MGGCYSGYRPSLNSNKALPCHEEVIFRNQTTLSCVYACLCVCGEQAGSWDVSRLFVLGRGILEHLINLGTVQAIFGLVEFLAPSKTMLNYNC